jgi:hypothetical protein
MSSLAPNVFGARDLTVARNTTQISQSDQSFSGRFLAPLGMTAYLLSAWSVASHKIENGKRRIQSEKKE